MLFRSRQVMPTSSLEYKDLQALGFSVREIEILTKVSKSTVSRTLMEERQ